MKRRAVYKLVAENAARLGGNQALLTAAIDVMRALRDNRAIDPAHSFDAEIVAILNQDDALAQLYQALNAPALERAYRGTARERRKFSEAEIPSVTQLFTPRFVVEFLLHNSLGRMWMSMHPDSTCRFPMLVSQAIQRPAKRACEIRILDPACGTMNFGIVAIEMLDAMYRDELVRLGPERASIASEDQIPAAIAQHNLFGIDIDSTALELAAQTLSMKLRLPVANCRANLWCGDALFDSSIEAGCAGAFDVVVTNPPYLSARNLDPARVKQLKRRYPASWRDIYACFIERSLHFACEGGYAGLLAMQSFMFTGAFEKLRRKLGEIAAIDALAHFGPGLFDIGNPGTLQTAAVVLRRESDANVPQREPDRCPSPR